MGNKDSKKIKKDQIDSHSTTNTKSNENEKDKEKKKLITEIKILKEILGSKYSQKESIKKKNEYDLQLKLISNDLNLEGLTFEANNLKKKDEKNKRTIGVIGRSNVGKTFILNQLTNGISENQLNELNSINVKYIDNIVYLEASSYDGINNIYSNSELIKLIQEFVITISNILIIVVDNYTLEDLLILNIIKKICYWQKIIVIHNLYYFKKVENIEDYIKNFLKHEGTNLEEYTYFNLGDNDQNKNYYLELFNRKIDNEEINIIHLLYADNGITELKKKYNSTSLQYIKTQIESCVIQMKKFSLYDDFLNFIFDYLQKPHEKQLYQEEKEENKLRASISSFLNNDENVIGKIKENKDNKKIVNPKYYIFKDNNEIIVKIEFYKKPLKLKFNSSITEKNIIIYLKGNKEAPNKNQTEDEEEIFNNFQRNDLNFELEIKIPLDFVIIDISKKKIEYIEKEQILQLVFPIYEYEEYGKIEIKNPDKVGGQVNTSNTNTVKVGGQVNTSNTNTVIVSGEISSNNK